MYYPLSSLDVLRFDNTYSVLQSKKVSLSVEVLTPEGEPQPRTRRGEAQLD